MAGIFKWDNNATVLIFLGVLFFVVGNGVLSLSNPDEVFYALTGKEMIRNGMWNVAYIFG